MAPYEHSRENFARAFSFLRYTSPVLRKFGASNAEIRLAKMKNITRQTKRKPIFPVCDELNTPVQYPPIPIFHHRHPKQKLLQQSYALPKVSLTFARLPNNQVTNYIPAPPPYGIANPQNSVAKIPVLVSTPPKTESW